MRVAVLYGGMSAEREVSLKSGAAVISALESAGVDVIPVDVSEGWLKGFLALEFDIAFLALHGRGGEDGTIQGLLDSLSIPYTGSGVLGSALAMDKIRTKQVWQSLGLPTPEYAIINHDSNPREIWSALGGTMMVKPVHEGSSIGLSKVERIDELESAILKAEELDSQVLAEKWVTGKEYTVTILDGKALPAIGLETHHQFYDYEAKYLVDDTHYMLPCGLSEADEQYIQQLAVEAFEAVGCCDWGRVDLMIDEQGQVQLLEVNTLPGMTDHSLVPMAANAAGYSLAELVLTIIRSAQKRYQSR